MLVDRLVRESFSVARMMVFAHMTEVSPAENVMSSVMNRGRFVFVAGMAPVGVHMM